MFKKGTGYSKACLVWLMLVCERRILLKIVSFVGL